MKNKSKLEWLKHELMFNILLLGGEIIWIREIFLKKY